MPLPRSLWPPCRFSLKRSLSQRLSPQLRSHRQPSLPPLSQAPRHTGTGRTCSPVPAAGCTGNRPGACRPACCRRSRACRGARACPVRRKFASASRTEAQPLPVVAVRHAAGQAADHARILFARPADGSRCRRDAARACRNAHCRLRCCAPRTGADGRPARRASHHGAI